MRPCLGYRCDQVVERGRSRCPACELEHDVSWVYTDSRWEPARQACFARDGYRCSCGHHDPTARTLHAHHSPKVRVLIPLGFAFDVDFLETKCSSCHSRLTAEGQ